jgi:hypothetical protein
MTPTVGAAEAVSGHNAAVGLVTPGPLVGTPRPHHARFEAPEGASSLRLKPLG